MRLKELDPDQTRSQTSVSISLALGHHVKVEDHSIEVKNAMCI